MQIGPFPSRPRPGHATPLMLLAAGASMGGATAWAGQPALAEACTASAAGWACVIDFGRRGGDAEDLPRLATGLILGAALAHLCWVALYPAVLEAPAPLLARFSAGRSGMFVPLGLLLVTLRHGDPSGRFAAAAFGALPIGLATARTGCLALGCCPGGPAPWGTHPFALYEIAGLLGLARIARCVPPRLVAGVCIAGLGILRLALEPTRALPALGPPALPVQSLAFTLVAVGAFAAARPARWSPGA